MKLGYLIGQYPAINHGYLLQEITILRQEGFQIETASIALPDRPDQELPAPALEEKHKTYYVKGEGVARSLLASALFFLEHPIRSFRGVITAVRFAGLKPARMIHYLFYLGEAVLVVRWMRRAGIRHIHASFSATVGVLACKIAPITMSFGVYGFGEVFDPVGTHLAERIQSSLFVRCISKHLRSVVMITCPAQNWPKLIWAPLGIDPCSFPRPARPNDTELYLLSVGRIAPEKGQRLLVEACTVLRQKGDVRPFTVHLVGNGPDAASLQRSIDAAALTDVMRLEGEFTGQALTDFYARTHVFVLPSLYEGIPTVLMEAMVMEVPCVAPRITGIPELIEDGVNGLLFTPGDVEDMSRAMSRLMSDSELRANLGKRARQTVLEKYSIIENSKRFGAMLRERLG